MNKKFISVFTTAAIVATIGLTSCKQAPAPAASTTAASTNVQTPVVVNTSGSKAAITEPGTPVTGTITVLTRESGSGTRTAFAELFGLKDGETDKIKKDAEAYNSTSDIINKVSANQNAIGYISLGSLAGNPVKGVKIDGVEPSAANVENGKYAVKRPFNIIVPPEHGGGKRLSVLGLDFHDFIVSKQGQKIVADAGYIPLAGDKIDYAQLNGKQEGSLLVAGSSSVSPLMEKLIEGYVKLNPNADIQLQQSDSTTGITSVEDGTADMGMSSRELKETEKAKAQEVQIATDGIAVIVNPKNPVENLSKEQVKEIFNGSDTEWTTVSSTAPAVTG